MCEDHCNEAYILEKTFWSVLLWDEIPSPIPRGYLLCKCQGNYTWDPFKHGIAAALSQSSNEVVSRSADFIYEPHSPSTAAAPLISVWPLSRWAGKGGFNAAAAPASTRSPGNRAESTPLASTSVSVYTTLSVLTSWLRSLHICKLVPYSSFQNYEMPILENMNNCKSSESDLMWQKKAIGQVIITTQICRNFFLLPVKNFLNLDKTQAWGVLDKCFSFPKPKNSLQIVHHTFISMLLNATVTSGEGKGW